MKTGLLFSGGLDSTALLYWKKPSIAIFVDYGQPQVKGEYIAVKKIAREVGIQLKIIRINHSLPVAENLIKNEKICRPTDEWWPFRNQLIITYASSLGIILGLSSILLGAVKTDNIYKDGTKKFFQLMNKLTFYQEGNIKIQVPAIELESPELIIRSKIPNSILLWSHSCTRSEFACGLCPSCQKRNSVLNKLKIVI